MVDPRLLSQSSRKFHDLIQPLLNGQEEVGKMNLQITCDNFTERGVENFLKLCQNLPTDVKNSEVKEICEIAKMFQADQIYNTGLNFVRSNEDPNFFVPDNKYDNASNLIISAEAKKIHHVSDFGSLEFESSGSSPLNEINGESSNASNYSQISGIESVQSQSNFQNSENVDQNNNTSTTQKIEEKPDQIHTIVYEIRIEQQPLKLPIYQFVSDGDVKYSAKHKDNTIVIGKGSTIHLNKDRSNHIARISLNDGINIVSCNGQDFHISFVYLARPGTFSIETEFTHEKRVLHWKAREPKYNPHTGAFTLPLHGEYHHVPMKSDRNTVLVNDAGSSCMIIRKVGNNHYEAECNPAVSEIIVFALAISQIIGPSRAYANSKRF